MNGSDRHISGTTRKVLKVLGIFGGVQAISILCAVLRTKLVALWLGPAGVGLFAIFNSTMDMIAKTAQLNLDQSAVRDLACNRDKPAEGARTVAVVRKLSLLLGLGGMAAVALGSPLISLWAFGNTSYTLAFAALSVWLLFAILTNGEWAVMRGYDRLKQLGKASLWSALTAIAGTVPLLYFLRIDGIVPTLLVYYGVTCLFTILFRVKDIPKVPINLHDAWHEGSGMMRLGAYMTMSNTVTLLASNILVIYLNRRYGEDAVGLYQSGFTLVNTYVGIIFTAIVMEYYPRLSTVIGGRLRTEVVVSHEIKLAVWVLMPVAIVFICCSRLIVGILYSQEFYAVLPYVAIGACGIFFRAASWCVAYTILAKGDGRIYVCTEAASAIAYLALHIPLYNAFGFTGLGIAYVAWYAVYFLSVCAVYRFRYKLGFRPGIITHTLCGFACAAATVALSGIIGAWLTLPLMLIPVGLIALRRFR